VDAELLYLKMSINTPKVSSGDYLSFEYLSLMLKVAPHIFLFIIYWPPNYSLAFFDNFTELLSPISFEFDCCE